MLNEGLTSIIMMISFTFITALSSIDIKYQYCHPPRITNEDSEAQEGEITFPKAPSEESIKSKAESKAV